MIWKGSVGTGSNEVHQVHGLTTAASVWLSAAVGVAAGGKLYFIASYCVALIIVILRFGPKLYGSEEESGGYFDEDEDGWETDVSVTDVSGRNSKNSNVSDINDLQEVQSVLANPSGGGYGSVIDSSLSYEVESLLNSSKKRKNKRLSGKKQPSFHS